MEEAKRTKMLANLSKARAAKAAKRAELLAQNPKPKVVRKRKTKSLPVIKEEEVKIEEVELKPKAPPKAPTRISSRSLKIPNLF